MVTTFRAEYSSPTETSRYCCWGLNCTAQRPPRARSRSRWMDNATSKHSRALRFLNDRDRSELASQNGNDVATRDALNQGGENSEAVSGGVHSLVSSILDGS